MRLASILSILFAACASTLSTIPQAWMSTAQKTPPKRPVAGPITHAGKALTPPFSAVDSVSVSEARKEVAFSVRRGNYDLGLVPTEGGEIRWLPADAADEVDVQWAPRGNKISYTVRAPGGDIVKTLHIPTAASLMIDFPFGRVHSLVWDMPAERFTVRWSSPDRSVRTEIMKYDGAERRTLEPAKSALDVTVEPFGRRAIVLRPSALRYDERLPLVVWHDDDLFTWNEARADLIRNARVALVVTRDALDDEFWQLADATAWLDPARTYTVGLTTARGTSIVGDPALPAGRYRSSERSLAAPPAVVQSFAAGFIADQLKRTPPTNGSSR